MAARYIRTLNQSPATNSDTDSFLLAHSIIDWNSVRDKRSYSGYLRSSSIHDSCIREQIIGLHEHVEVSENVSLQLAATFEIGNAVHFWLQNEHRFFKDRLIGWWECLACGDITFGRKPKSRCTSCGALSRAVRYREHEIKVKEPVRGIGHVDLFLETSKGNIEICDIKTIAGDKFLTLEEPLIQNQYQVIDYMLLMELDNNLPVKVNTESSIVLYIPKAHQAKNFPAKAFRVKKRKEIVDSIMKKRIKFTNSVKDGMVPEPLKCCISSNFTGYRAKSCPVLRKCIEVCGFDY